MQISTSAAKKLWEKGGGGMPDMKMPSVGVGSALAPLQLHGSEHQVWRDSTWSTQGETILPARRPFASSAAPGSASTQSSSAGGSADSSSSSSGAATGTGKASTTNGGILSPRDATGGLGVKMVEYVLCGSPTNTHHTAHGGHSSSHGGQDGESTLSGLEPRLRTLTFEENEKVSGVGV